MSSKRRPATAFEEWVLRAQGTEPPFSGVYNQHREPGIYRCKSCQAALFTSEAKFSSKCGWPSFDADIAGAVTQRQDPDGQRTEIICTGCEAHLGHVFVGEGFTARNTRHCVNSVCLDFEPEATGHQKLAVLASGCFWGTEYYFSRLSGVLRTRVGYTGGHVAMPSYRDICTGLTGHVEAIEVCYDPERLSYQRIIEYFFETHDFSQADGQGPDIGPQYHSVIFYTHPDEKQVIETVMTELRSKGFDKIATVLKPLESFYPAEAEHQNYYEAHGKTPYCHTYTKIF